MRGKAYLGMALGLGLWLFAGAILPAAAAEETLPSPPLPSLEGVATPPPPPVVTKEEAIPLPPIPDLGVEMDAAAKVAPKAEEPAELPMLSLPLPEDGSGEEAAPIVMPVTGADVLKAMEAEDKAREEHLKAERAKMPPEPLPLPDIGGLAEKGDSAEELPPPSGVTDQEMGKIFQKPVTVSEEEKDQAKIKTEEITPPEEKGKPGAKDKDTAKNGDGDYLADDEEFDEQAFKRESAASRREFNYKTQMLPDLVYQRHYSRENEHLPLRREWHEYELHLLNAAAQGDINSMRALIGAGVDINTQDEVGNSPLIVATQALLADAVHFLLSNRADPNLADDNGFAPLHYAAFAGDTGIAAMLVEKGAQLNAMDAAGTTPLMFAVKNNRVAMAEWLLARGADIHLANRGGDTALLLATQSGNPEILNLLYISGADIETPNNYGDTPLMVCAARGDNPCVAQLLENGANIDARNVNGLTAASLAARNGKRSTADLLATIAIKRQLAAARAVQQAPLPIVADPEAIVEGEEPKILGYLSAPVASGAQPARVPAPQAPGESGYDRYLRDMEMSRFIHTLEKQGGAPAGAAGR